MYNPFQHSHYDLTSLGQLPANASTSYASSSSDPNFDFLFDFTSQLTSELPFATSDYYTPQMGFVAQDMPIIVHQDAENQHGHSVYTDTQLPAEWASMALQVPAHGASRTPPAPSPNRHHPYASPGTTYRRQLSRSLSSELALPAPPAYPPPLAMSQSLSTLEQRGTHLAVPAYGFLTAPATPTPPATPTTPVTPATPATPTTSASLRMPASAPRRVRIPQSFAPSRARRHAAYTVRFKVNGTPGFRVGDALKDRTFTVDDASDIVLEMCVDRKGHLQVDLPAPPPDPEGTIEQRGSYLNLQRENVVDKVHRIKEYYRYTRLEFAHEVARALQRAAEQNKKLGLRLIPYEDFYITYATRGAMNKWVLGLEKIEWP